MRDGRNRYAMLVCSLPALPTNLFGERQTPISRLQLDRRLALLDPALVVPFLARLYPLSRYQPREYFSDRWRREKSWTPTHALTAWRVDTR